MNSHQQEQFSGCLRRLAEGDRDAFRPAFEAILPVLRKFFIRAGTARVDIDDLTQKVMLKVFSRIDQYDASREGLPWVLGIAAYELKTHWKKQQRSREQLMDTHQDGHPSLQLSPQQLAIDANLRQAITEAIGQLSQTDQETIRTFLDDEHTRMDAKLRKRWQRAKQRLRQIWRHTYDY